MIAVAAAALTAAWLAASVSGGVTIGSITISPLAAAVGAGGTALAATYPAQGRTLLVGPVLLVGMPAAAALAAGGHAALPLAGVTAACLLAAGPGWRPARWSLLAGGLGTAAALTGLVLTRSDLRPGVLAVEGTAAATALAAAAALFITATALAPGEDDGLRLLLLPGLVIGWTVAPLVDGAAPAAGVLALGALAIARHRPAALAFAACALAAVAPTQPAAALLAAGVVLFAAVGPALAWPALIPGVAAAALALAGGPAAVDSVAAGLAVAAGSAALATAVRAPAVLRPRSLPAAVLALWLAVAPATWAWAGEARLGDYQEGAARALAAGLLVTVVAWMTGQLRPPAPEWRSDGW